MEKYIQEKSPDGGFLQSEEWRKFQESVGRKTYCIYEDNFYASIIEHYLPVVGKYFYIPRGPIFNLQFSIFNDSIKKLIDLAKKNNIGWIRIEPVSKKIFNEIGKTVKYKIVKAPHDMQPKEILVLDITKPEEETLSQMKSKTRYNIKLAEKKGIKILNFKFSILNQIKNPKSQIPNNDYNNYKNYNYYILEFLRLVKITAERDKITSHPENYYRKMFEIIPGDVLKLYISEYENKIIAANLVIFYGGVATYLHGASDNEHRNLMAPYLLQWKAIQDAKKGGFKKYDLGGIHTKTGEGITKFKTGFAPNASPVVFPGCYDIVINPSKYRMYKIIQRIKNLL